MMIQAPIPEGRFIYTTIMELGPQNHNGYGLLGLNSIIVGYMDPLGILLQMHSPGGNHAPKPSEVEPRQLEHHSPHNPKP